MMMTGTVTVRLKSGVLDPEGKTIHRALMQMGFDGVSDVRTGRTFQIHLEAKDATEARQRLIAMSEKLLANPVVESFDVDVPQ